MSKIKIMCTSTGCIDYAPERYRNMGIDIIRVRVYFNGKEYKEGLDLDPVDFYRQLENIEDPKSNLPKTNIPATEDIRACFDRAVADGYDEVLVFTIAATLGGTFNHISLVAKDYEDKIKIQVIDTMLTSFGEGMLAIKAAEFAAKGMTSEEILKEIRWLMKHQLFMGIDGKLDYLIYNGRLKGGKAFFGQMLTPKKALARTCELLKERIGDRDPEDYLLWHVYTGPSMLETLMTIEPKFGIQTNHEPVIMSPVSGAHNGPWLAGYGLLFLRREDEPLED